MGLGAALPVVSDLSFAQLLDVGRLVRADTAPTTPIAFDPHQLRTVTALADILLPSTETPGASDAGVPAFLDRIVSDWYTEPERTRFLQGLAELDARAEELFGVVFAEATPGGQAALVAELDQQVQAVLRSEAERPAGAPSAASESFFYQMKNLTLTGYFTSEAGMTEVLEYRVVPGTFQPCIPFNR